MLILFGEIVFNQVSHYHFNDSDFNINTKYPSSVQPSQRSKKNKLKYRNMKHLLDSVIFVSGEFKISLQTRNILSVGLSVYY